MLPAPAFTDDIARLQQKSQMTDALAMRTRTATRTAAQDFEALFLNEMLSYMFTDIDTRGLFGGGASEEIYRSMLVQEYSRQIAASGGIGITDAVQKQMLKIQEESKV